MRQPGEPCSDTVVEENVEFLRSRSDAGLIKYSVTLDRDDLSADEWIQHAMEECGDFLNYLRRLKRKLAEQ